MQKLRIRVILFVVLWLGIATLGTASQQISLETARSKLLLAGWSLEVADRILQKVSQSSERMIAVFDHDNTLVCADVTEGNKKDQPGLAQLMITQNRLRNPAPLDVSFATPEDLWEHYHQWTQKDPAQAYPWVTTVFGGYLDTEAREIAEEYYTRYIVPRIFPEMKGLVEVLQELGVEVFIVSASCEWFVKPSARHFGVPEDHVLGIRLARRGSVILPKVIPPVSFAGGKTWYIQNFMGSFPAGNILVFGDSLRTDGHMLRFAARQNGYALLVNPSDEARKILKRDGIDSYPLPSLALLRSPQ